MNPTVPNRSRLFAIVFLLTFAAKWCVSVDAAVVPVSWADGNGNWGTASNWSPQQVPNNDADHEYEVTIDNPGAIVHLDISATANTVSNHNSLYLDSHNLTVTTGLENWGLIYQSPHTPSATITGDVFNASGATVEVYALDPGHGTTLKFVSGTWENEGTISVEAHSTWTNTPAFLVAEGIVAFTGTGHLTLAPVFSGATLQTGAAGSIITNSVGHTIGGAGAIHGPIVNYGTIASNYSYYSTSTLSSDHLTNFGTLTADAGHLLKINDSFAWGGGQIGGDGTVGATAGASLSGTLLKSGAGVFNLATSGNLSVADSTSLTISGGILNLFPTGGSGFIKDLALASGVTVNAGGADQYFSGGTSITNEGLLNITGGTKSVGEIVGSEGTITVGVDDSQTATLAVNYIRAHKLVLNPGSVAILGDASGAASPHPSPLPAGEGTSVLSLPAGEGTSVSSLPEGEGTLGSVGASAVPEPSTLALLAAAGMLILLWRRRTRL